MHNFWTRLMGFPKGAVLSLRTTSQNIPCQLEVIDGRECFVATVAGAVLRKSPLQYFISEVRVVILV